MGHDVNRIEFVKAQKQNASYKQANIFFKSVLIALHYFKKFFHYVLLFSVKCFICSVAFCLLSSSVFKSPLRWCVYFQILYNTMDFHEWKVNLIPIKLQMYYLQKKNWARLLKHGMLLTRHLRICTCGDSMSK